MKDIILISGASSGIGRETALKFSKNGHSIIAICNKNKQGLDSLVEEITQLGGKIYPYIIDVAQFDKVSEMFKDLESKKIMPDIIINNAGISYIGLLQDMTSTEWSNVVNTNLTSVFNLSKSAIPYMVEKQNGKIINISSMWGNVGASCEVAYSASKGGVNTFTKALAKELAPSNIAVNAIAFGAVNTRMNDFLTDKEKDQLVDEIPAGRILEASEAADIIYSVATINNYVTGQIITADGAMN